MPPPNILQTGSPWGYFKCGQLHPTIPDRHFVTYKKNKRNRPAYEEWESSKTRKNRLAKALQKGLEIQTKKRGGPSIRPQLQTGAPKGTYKFREPHPSVPDRFFINYKQNSNCEKWGSGNHIKNLFRRSDELKRQRRQLMTICAIEHRPILECLYDYRDRLNSIFGKAKFHLDHTIPISKGGCHHPKNLQIVPAKWNNHKGNRHFARWN